MLFLAIYMYKFLFSLEKRVRNLFILAAVFYVLGAFGFEMINGYYSESFGKQNFVYVILVTVEELFEKTGIVILFHAIIKYLEKEWPDLNLKIVAGGPPS